MGNAAFAYDNLADADATTITASDALALAPASRLTDPHVARTWRVNDDEATLTIDLGSSVSFAADELTIMLAGINLTTDGTTRVRVSNTDPTGVLGEQYDSGSATGRVNERYGYLIALVTAAVTARYILINLSETGLSYIEAGRLFIGERNEVAINFDLGWSRQAMRRSRDTDGVDGQTFVDLRRGYWAVDATFAWLSETERNGFVEDIEATIVNDGHIDMLFCAPEWAGKGLASALYQALEGAARRLGIVRFHVEASAVARPVFERWGFTVVRRQDVTLAGGTIHNYVMVREPALTP